MDPKTIRYSIVRKDVFAFNLRAAARSRLNLAVMLVLMAFLVYVGLFMKMEGNHPQPSMAARILGTIFMGLAALLFMIVFQLLFLFLAVWTKRFKGLIGEHEMTLTDEGMISKSASSETTRKWNSLFRIVSTGHYLLLFVNETSAMIVPKRYFTSRAEAASFEQIIRERAKTD